MPLPRQSGGAKPMACSSPSRRSQRSASAAPAAASCSGEVTSISSTSGSLGQLAGGPLGQGEGPPGAREHDLGPLLLGQPGHGEGQGGVGEDAGDEEALSVEESHQATSDGYATVGTCTWEYSGGTGPGRAGGGGPAGRGRGPGHPRLARRRSGPRAWPSEVVAALARSGPAHRRVPTTRARPAAERGRGGHPVGQRRRHGAAVARAAGRQGGRLHGQCPGQGGPRDAGPDPAPGVGGRRGAGRPARVAGGGRVPPPAGVGNGEPRVGVGSRRAGVLGPPRGHGGDRVALVELDARAAAARRRAA